MSGKIKTSRLDSSINQEKSDESLNYFESIMSNLNVKWLIKAVTIWYLLITRNTTDRDAPKDLKIEETYIFPSSLLDKPILWLF